jgi:adenine-specific DNA-methyltransferase
MQLNAEDGGNRRFIMVQLPELTDEKSEAYKAGYKNICEIGKERIRRAGRKIKEENASKEGIERLDIGFRVLKLDESNMADVYYTPADTPIQTTLNFDALVDNIREGRTAEDLLFQVLPECNLPLSSTIETREIHGKKVFVVEDGYLMACFDSDINDAVITAIAKEKPYYFVMCDRSIASDSVADNFDQIFNAYSKETVRRIL